MPLQITGRHTEVSQKDRDYLEKKLPRIRRLCDRIDELAVVFALEKKAHVVEINFRSGTIHVFTKASAETVTAAIDRAVDKVHSQVAKAREKKFGNKIHATKTIRSPVESIDVEPEDAES